MRRRILITIVTAGLVAPLLVALPAESQSLAEVAKREEARRKATPDAVKIYTNEDLTPDFTEPTEVAPTEAASAEVAPTAETPSGNASPSVASGQPPVAAARAEPPLDEALWRRRAAGIKVQVDKARADVAALDKPPVDDAGEQAKIAKLLATAKTLLDRAEDAWRLFLMQADAARVPADWIK